VKDDVSDSVIAALIEHRGPLGISGLSTITPARAAILAGQQGLAGLVLPDVRTLDVAAAEILARHRAGLLDLGDINRFSAETAAALRRHPFYGFETVGS
jgi:hypothetical protein